MPAEPLVSILINNYNYGRFLGQAIESALAQTYAHVEVVVVDDGSTDDSIRVIQNFGDRVVPVLKDNGGQATAFNAGFLRSTGSLVLFLDADDLFAPEKVQRILQVFADHPSIGWAFDLVKEFEGVDPPPLGPPQAAPYLEHLDAQDRMRAGSPPSIPTSTSGLCFRRSMLAQVLPMPDSHGIRLSDGYLKWTAMLLAPGVLVHDQLTLQRIHPDNLYTRKALGKVRLTGEIETNTASAIDAAFPQARRFAFKLLAHGLGAFWATGGLDSQHRALFRSMMQRASVPLRLETYLRSLYWAFRKRAKA